jgi:hypothetical protein
MIQVEKFNHTFNVREGEECHEVWEGNPDECPLKLITFAATDGADGLMWDSWEDFWMEYGIHPNELNPIRLLQSLVGYIAANEGKL